MKIAIITIVDNINYGTYLQAYATYEIIKSLGHDPIIINYTRPYISSKEVAVGYLKNTQMSLFKRLSYASFYTLLYPFMIWQVKRFLTSNVKMTPLYRNYNELKQAPPKADIFLTGSDQVWNSNYNNGIDESFFLSFTKKRKYAYAASIGLNSFPIQEKEKIKKLLLEYKAISVRELFGVEALHNIGINNIIQVLDPTLLFTKEKWLSMIKIKKKKKENKYLLIYSVESGRNDFVLQQAKEIANKRNLKLYWVCPTYKFKRSLGVDKVYNFASIKDFIYLFANADFIIASSFHGTAFAINFNKEFLSVSPGKYNTRVCSLLKLCKLENRYISDRIKTNESLTSIDYNSVNSILNVERRNSISYLTQICN